MDAPKFYMTAVSGLDLERSRIPQPSRMTNAPAEHYLDSLGTLKLRILALYFLGAATMAGHLGLSLGRFGLAAIVPNILFAITVSLAILSLPTGANYNAFFKAGAVSAAVALPSLVNLRPGLYGDLKVDALLQFTIPLLIVSALLSQELSDLDRFWYGAVVTALIGTALSAVDLASGIDLGTRGSASVATINPISTGRVAGLVLLAIILGGFNRFARPLRVGLSVLSIVVLLASASRGPILAVVVAVVVVGVHSKVLRGRLALIAGFVSLALILGLGSVVLGESASRILEESSGEATRIDMWGEAISAIPIHPLGAGLAQFGNPDGIAGSHNWVHNLPLELAVEFGFHSAVALFMVGGWLIYRMWQSPDPSSVRHLGFFIFWIFTAQFSSDINGNRPLLIAMFIAAAAYGSDSGRTSDNPSGAQT